MPAKHITDAFVRNVRPPDPGKGSARQVAYIDTIERGLALVLVVKGRGVSMAKISEAKTTEQLLFTRALKSLV